MRSPIGSGWVSSAYGIRGGGFHAGIDLRADGGYGSTAVAAFAGTVERTVGTRVHDRSGQQVKNTGKPTIAPARTGNGVIVRNRDGERQLYGHVAPSVTVGQVVTEGQPLGTIDDSGNTSGPHVHYEEWTGSGATRNPEVSFRKFGVEIKRGGGMGRRGDVAAPSANVQKKLKAMGLDPTEPGVRQYQRAHGLFEDGDWSGVTETYYQWVRDLQAYLNTCAAVRPIVRIDGDRGEKTKAAEKQAKRAATEGDPYRPPKEPPKRA